MAISVFVRQEKITVRMGLQSDPIDLTKTRLLFITGYDRCLVYTFSHTNAPVEVSVWLDGIPPLSSFFVVCD